MHIKEVEILNLWGGDPVSIPLDKRVTFITGLNGSGKSSLLNIIFDSVSMGLKGQKPCTSKQRFWSTKITFDNNIVTKSFVTPGVDSEKEELTKKIQKMRLDDEEQGLHAEKTILDIEKLFAAEEENKFIKHVDYEHKSKGEIRFHERIFINEKDKVKIEHLENELDNYIPFIFQEDRTVLHNTENLSLDLNDPQNNFYSASIDVPFAIMRERFQTHESKIHAQLSSLILDKEFTICNAEESKPYKDAMSKMKEIANLINMINVYFNDTNKEISRDDNNRVTVKYKGKDNAPISWSLLSRGEKTVIYLFLMVFLNKDKVNLFLLDEPETAIHIGWQPRLIRDLSNIAENSKFVVATHSPSLVENGWLDNCLEVYVGP